MLAYFARVTLLAAACGAMLLAGIPKFEDQGVTMRSAALEEAGSLNGRQQRNSKDWMRTPALPSVVDGQLRDLAGLRRRFVRSWDDYGSGIDIDRTFGNAVELVTYAPRALQIGLFSPFPSLWFSSSDRPTGRGMRIASAFEMLLAYLFLLGLPIFLWRNRMQPAVWMLSFVCISMLVVYATIIPNVGALYRFRYPYFMPLVCMGLLGWIGLLRSRSLRSRPGVTV